MQQQQRDSVGTVPEGGCIISAVRCAAVRSDSWVMVMLVYSTKRMISPNFRSLIFYIMYHFVRNYKDRFDIHVNTQTVLTFLDVGTCTTC